RVEAMTDGGSAVYGSDALGGVINMITRRRFDGTKIDGHYSLGEGGYRAYDISATVGKDWGSGSAYVSYAFSKHDTVFGADRDWVKRQFWSGAFAGTPSETLCTTANVKVGTNFYSPTGASGLTAATTRAQNYCDNSKNIAIYPAQHQHNVFASLTQDVSDS